MKNKNHFWKSWKNELRVLKKIERWDFLYAAIAMVVIVTATIAASQAQWSLVTLSTNQSDYETYSTRTSDGNYITVINGTGITAQKMDSGGNKLWNSGNPVTIDAGGSWASEVQADNSGGAFTVFVDGGINVSRLNTSGTVLWTTNVSGTGVWPRIRHDGNNGVYVAWYNGNPMTTYVTHLDSNGNLYSNWNNGGSGTYRPVEFAPIGISNLRPEPKLALSDSNSIIVTILGTTQIASHKLSSTGAELWSNAVVDNPSSFSNQNWQAESDGSNGVHIAYWNYNVGGGRSLKLAGFDSSGNWTIGGPSAGLTVKTLVATGSPYYTPYYMVSASDSSGNFYLGWNEKPNTSAEYDAYVQKFNSSGVEQWTTGGVLLGTLNDNVSDYFESMYLYNSPHNLVAAGNGGAIVAVKRVTSGHAQIMAQKINSAGNKIWGSGYLSHTDFVHLDDYYHDVVSDGSGGAMINWYRDYFNSGHTYSIVAQNVKTALPSAPANPVATAYSNSVQLAWDAVDWADTYAVYRSTDGGNNYSAYHSVSGTSYNDTSVTNGNTYYYKITAVNETGESGYSVPVNATPMARTMGLGSLHTLSANVSGQPYTTRTSDGNFFVVWPKDNAGTIYLRVQKINSQTGAEMWTAGGIQLADIFDRNLLAVPDNAGGAYIGYKSTSTTVRAQHIDSNGTATWGAGGLTLLTGAFTMGDMRPDGSGGMYLAAGVYNTNGYVFHLNSAGNAPATWNTTGSGTYRPVLLTMDNTLLMSEPDSGGNIFVGGSVAATGVNYVAKITPTGLDPVWGEKTMFSDTENWNAYGPSLSSDGNGGVVIVADTWDNINFTETTYRIAINSAGTRSMTNLATDLPWYGEIFKIGTNYTHISTVWSDAAGADKIRAIQFDSSGNLQWGGETWLYDFNEASNQDFGYEHQNSYYDGWRSIYSVFGSDSDDQIRIQQLNYTDGSLGLGTTGTVVSESGINNFASIVGNTNGQALVTWYNREGLVKNIQYKIYNFELQSDVTPTITGVSPDTGSSQGGTDITITGTNFRAGATVKISTSSATNVVVVNSTTITARTPGWTYGGWYDVTVTNTDNTTGTLTDGFHYLEYPIVSIITPDNGDIAGGTPFTIGGQYIFTGATVTFGGVPATNYTYDGGMSVSGLTPAHAGGVVNVIVTNPAPDGGATTMTGAFTYTGGGGGGSESTGDITIGCGAGSTTLSATPSATFEARTVNFYQDSTNAPLTGDLQIDLTDTRTFDPGPDNCGPGATIQVQTTGLTKDGLGIGPILGLELNTPASMACSGSCAPVDINDVATLTGSTGSLSTAKSLISTSEAFTGTIRTTLSGTDLEITKPTAVLPLGTYSGTITFTQI